MTEECLLRSRDCAGDVTFGQDDEVARVYDLEEEVWVCERHRIRGI